MSSTQPGSDLTRINSITEALLGCVVVNQDCYQLVIIINQQLTIIIIIIMVDVMRMLSRACFDYCS